MAIIRNILFGFNRITRQHNCNKPMFMQCRQLNQSNRHQKSHAPPNDSLICSVADDPRKSHNVDTSDFISPSYNVDTAVDELVQGKGYYVLKGLFSDNDIDHAREVVHYLIDSEGSKATHFQGDDGATPQNQARTWNLLNKGVVFEKFVQHPLVLAITEQILGDDLQLGSIAGNTLFPGASGQEPHIDYPYWDYYNKKHWPVTPKTAAVPFHMNMQATILLDDFTEENGATGVITYTQRECSYPKADEFFKNENLTQITGKRGDVMLFPGLIQHAAMPNKSKASRTGILLQYLPKYIRPMEDIKRAISADVMNRATPRLKQLLLCDYPYPAILDEAEAGNSEGYASDFKWK